MYIYKYKYIYICIYMYRHIYIYIYVTVFFGLFLCLGGMSTQDLFIKSQDLFIKSQELFIKSQELFTAVSQEPFTKSQELFTAVSQEPCTKSRELLTDSAGNIFRIPGTACRIPGTICCVVLGLTFFQVLGPICKEDMVIPKQSPNNFSTTIADLYPWMEPDPWELGIISGNVGLCALTCMVVPNDFTLSP